MRLLSLAFDLPLPRRHIAGFRAAVARAAGYELDLLHNHRDDGSVQYRYPLVQYRSERGKAAIIGIDEGGDAIYNWYNKSNNRLLWNDAEHTLRIERIDVRPYEIEYHPAPRPYRLMQWVALNEKNYRNWQQMPGLLERTTELERLLAAHILSFCRAVNWRLPQRLEVQITDMPEIRRTRFLGVNMIGFDLEFLSNLAIPYGIGLGKAVSHGFGVCRPLRLEAPKEGI